MNIMTIYGGALGSFVLGSICIYGTSPFGFTSEEKWESRARRRLFAKVFFVLAAVCLAVGLIAQTWSFMVTPHIPGDP